MGTCVTGQKGGRFPYSGPAARRARNLFHSQPAHSAPRAIAHTLIGKEKSPI